MKRTIAIIVMILVAMTSAHCQEKIHGSVYDGKTGLEIPYATIQLKNSRIVATCDEAGKFSLNLSKGMARKKVIISSKGYETVTTDVRTLIKNGGEVLLQPSALRLQEVEVIDFVSVRNLLDTVARRMLQNYRTVDAIGIWKYNATQLVNDSLFVKREGLYRNLMPAFCKYKYPILGFHIIKDEAELDDIDYRMYQMLDTTTYFNEEYWRSLVGMEAFDEALQIQENRRPYNRDDFYFSDWMLTMSVKKSALFVKKKTKCTLETFTQDGTDYYRVTCVDTKKNGGVRTAVLVINKEELSIVDCTVEHNYITSNWNAPHYGRKKEMDEVERYMTRYYCHYDKYNGKYQMDSVQFEYEYPFEFKRFEFKQQDIEISGLPRLIIKSREESVLVEYDTEGVEEYKHRYFENEHPRTEENIRETERVLRQARAKYCTSDAR